MNKTEFQTVVVATTNMGKMREITELFADLPVELKSLTDFSDVSEVVENGRTFAENARLKAVGYALMTGTTTIADDSGLEVAALNNAPGIFSARYGGESLSDSEKNSKLLDELARTGDELRAARFRCAVAVASPDGTIIAEAEATCDGTIVYAPVGRNGFGYDPLFQPRGYNHTFGELEAKIKEKISHRGRAFRQIKHLWEK